MTLLVYLVGRLDKMYTVTYSDFSVSSAAWNYKLRISDSVQSSSNAMSTYSGRPFSTRDADNDAWTAGNCATSRGGWWWDDCSRAYVNINGDYSLNETSCVWWYGPSYTINCRLKYIAWGISF